MAKKPTYEDLEKKVLELEKANFKRKQAEESLRLTQFVFDKATIGIYHISSDGRILNVNEQVTKSIGYTKDELSKMTIPDIDPTLCQQNLESLWQTLCRNKGNRIETVHKHKDGKIFPVEVITNLFEYNGEQFSVSFVQDLTERNLADKERKELETKLQQNQRMEAIGTLAGGIAHDFNNILSGIFGYSQLAKNHLNDIQRAEKDIDNVIGGAKRAAELIGQILTFSRNSSYERQPLAIHSIVNEALTFLRASIPTSIEIRKTIVSTAKIMADPTKIHQVVLNLCTNAYHSMLETGGVLAAGLRAIEFSANDQIPELNIMPGSYLRLEISDTGHGMDASTKEKIFEPYFTTKTPDKGTGLGLAVVFGIVKEHDGHITVYSEPGQGTTFHVYFPIVKKFPITSPIAKEEEEESSTPTMKTILVVDDDEIVLKSTHTLLLDLGYNVNSVSDGTSAFEIYKENPNCFDLVITDMTMPGITGIELSIKILELRPEQPIILCTGYSALINREKALSIGIRHYFEKPITIKELSKVIRAALT